MPSTYILDPANNAKVHAALIKAYGKPTKGTEARNLTWMGKKVSLVYSVNVNKAGQHITFNSIRLNKLFESRYNSSVKKAASDL